MAEEIKASQTPQAFTAVINSATLTKPIQRVFLYQAVPELQTLGVEQRNIQDTVPTDVYSWQDAATSVAPKLRNPSSLVSLTFNDRLHIYGVLNGKNTIAMVSPVYVPVHNFPIAEQGHIAGTTDGKEAWLFWQTSDKVTEPYTHKILIKSIAGKPATPDDTGARDILNKTSLAAIHDGSNKWLLYQRTDKIPRLLCLGPHLSGEVKIGTTGTWFLPNTPIAALFVPKSHFKDDAKFGFGPKHKGRLYVYYLDAANVIYATYANLSSDNGSPTFTHPYQAGSHDKYIGDGVSQMTAVYDTVNRRNVIYAVLQDQENPGVTSLWDEWDSTSDDA